MYPINRQAAQQRLETTPGYQASLLTHLVNSADAIEAGWPSAAAGFLPRIAEETSPGTAAGRIARIFASSLLSRLSDDSAGGGNLYFDEPSPGAMLAAFQKLVYQTPFIRFGYAAANEAILQSVRRRSAVHLVDIGIGGGSQWFDFLEQLAYRLPYCTSVRLTGIDVPEPGDNPGRRLNEAGESLRAFAEGLGLDFTFRAAPTPVQQMDFSLLDRLPGEALAINAVFALHHVPTSDASADGVDQRQQLLRRLHAASPDVLALVEPDAQHNALPLNLLTREALSHYLTVFDALSELLPEEIDQRQTLEQAFFGREILNIVGADGSRRVERHERHAAWRRRLREHGFRSAQLPMCSGLLPKRMTSHFPIAVRTRTDGLMLTWKDRPVVAASAWTPTAQVQAA